MLDSWQKWLTFIVALASAYYAAGNFAASRFETSNTAIQAAESRMDLFRTQPGYVLTYLENAYPAYAYCAALSAVQACMSAIGTAVDVSPSCHQSADTFTGEQDGTAADGTDRVATSPMAGELIAQEIDAIARKVGLSEAVLAAKARLLSEAPVPGAPARGCSGDLLSDDLDIWQAEPAVSPPGVIGRLKLGRSCVETLGLYMQSICRSRLEDLRATEVLAASQTEGDDELPAAAGDSEHVLVPAPGPEGETPGDAPGGCPADAVRPVIYPQVASEAQKAEAETLRGALGDRGWVLLPTEVVPSSSSGGDIRYYHAEQLGCAEQLASDIAGIEGGARPRLIFLGDRYRNLPRGRMELWLAAP